METHGFPAQPGNPPHIFKAISAVMSDLAKQGIGKTGMNTQQNFKFRSIDHMYGVITPILTKHNLILIPVVKKNERFERVTKSGSIMTYVVVTVQYQLVSTVDGSIAASEYIGEAADSGDKATSKALTMSLKYWLIHTFCIPVEGTDDGDAVTVEETVAPQPEHPDSLESQAKDALVDELVERASAAMRKATSNDQLNEVFTQAVDIATKKGIRDEVATKLTPLGKQLRAALNKAGSDIEAA